MYEDRKCPVSPSTAFPVRGFRSKNRTSRPSGDLSVPCLAFIRFPSPFVGNNTLDATCELSEASHVLDTEHLAVYLLPALRCKKVIRQHRYSSRQNLAYVARRRNCPRPSRFGLWPLRSAMEGYGRFVAKRSLATQSCRSTRPRRYQVVLWRKPSVTGTVAYDGRTVAYGKPR